MDCFEGRTTSPSNPNHRADRTWSKTIALVVAIVLSAAPGCASTGKTNARGPKGNELNITTAEHPIDRFVVRPSTASELAEWTARGNMGALATVKSLGATLDDVMARLDLYAEYIPKQASWHAELVAGNTVPPARSDQAFDDLTVTAAAFDRIAASLEGYPDLVSDERRMILDGVREERIAILGELLDQMSEIQVFVNEQRIDLMETQVTAQRKAVFEAVAAERATIIEAAIEERANTMLELQAMAEALIDRSAVKIVDHFFLRAVQLVAIVLVGLGLVLAGAVML